MKIVHRGRVMLAKNKDEVANLQLRKNNEFVARTGLCCVCRKNPIDGANPLFCQSCIDDVDMCKVATA